MRPKTTFPVLFDTEEIFKTFFGTGECLIDIDFPMSFLYSLNTLVRDDDKIILINVD